MNLPSQNTLPTLGLVPMLFASGPGSEIQKPLAAVVIGRLISSTLLTLFTVNYDTKFIKDWKFTDCAALKAGLRACAYYRSPFFGRPLVTKVMWTKQN